MHFKGTGYKLMELNEAPTSSGIYAWYYQIKLTDKDIASCIAEAKQAESEAERCQTVRDFLEQRLFQYYREAPYDVKISGQMKAAYEGSVNHVLPISIDLVKRISENPDRINSLKKLLYEAVPFFASPIYIGVAKNLRKRLQKHRTLIDKYSPDGMFDVYTPQDTDSEDDRADHSFALEVSRQRNFNPNYLVVFTMDFDAEENLHVDLENILNRINYPLCGRN